MGVHNVKNFKILGQEPVFWVSFVEAALMMLLTFGISGLDQDTVGVIVAAVSALLGLVTAYATKTTLYSALVGFSKAILVLAVTFGAPLNDAETGSIIAVVVLLAGAYLRGNTSSVATAISNPSQDVPTAVEITALPGTPPTDDHPTLFDGVVDGTISAREVRNQDTP